MCRVIILCYENKQQSCHIVINSTEMSLVAYADSDDDSSDNELSEDVSASVAVEESVEYRVAEPFLSTDPVLNPENDTSLQNKLRLPAPLSAFSKQRPDVTTTNAAVGVDNVHSSLFAGLPASVVAHKPGPKQSQTEDDLEDIVKPRSEELSLRQVPARKHGPVKIILPHLTVESDDSDDETAETKRRKNRSHKSGLLSSLPPPARVTNLTSLVPQSLSKAATAMKPKTTAPVSAQLTKPAVEPTRTVSSVKQAVNSRLIAPSAASSATDDSDEETGAGSAADFFSLDAADQPAMFLAALRNSEAVDVRWDGSTSYIQPTATFVSHNSVNMSAASATNYTLPTADHLQGLDVTGDSVQGPEVNSTSQNFEENFHDPQFQKAFGKRGPRGEVKVINVHLDEVLSGVDVTKNLPNDAEPMMSHSKKRNKDMPSSQQKRKHQISYLAFRAKERELELKNQWSENKFSRRQTQSKYGF